MNLSNLSSLVKIGAVTFAGAFLSALTLTTVPTTLEGWKVLVLPALSAAIAAEILFLKGQANSYLTGQTLSTPVIAAPVHLPSQEDEFIQKLTSALEVALKVPAKIEAKEAAK